MKAKQGRQIVVYLISLWQLVFTYKENVQITYIYIWMGIPRYQKP